MDLKKINWAENLPFLLMHFSFIAAFYVPFSWGLVGLCAASYFIRMFGITAGYHRYFSHRAYKANRVVQFAIAWLGSTSVQKGVLWWAANHRLHHRHSDQPVDIHSPIQKGFWWSHMGWILSPDHEETRWDQIQDLAKYPELRWLNKYHLVPSISFAVALLAFGGSGALVWGFFISTVILWHGTFTINSLSHVYGKVRYMTTDTSKNNFWLALVTLGEGWHNNHHCYMSSTRQGFFWWELDITYYLLKGFSLVGIVTDLREPPLKLLESKLLKSSPRIHTSTRQEREQVPQLERA